MMEQEEREIQLKKIDQLDRILKLMTRLIDIVLMLGTISIISWIIIIWSVNK